MRTTLPLLVLLSTACGVADGKLVAELSSDQAASVCEEYPERQVTCPGDDDSVELAINVDCGAELAAADASCPAQVGDYRLCMDTLEGLSDDELCEDAGTLPGECAALFDASCLGSPVE